ncbi:cellulase family glycosylhydrolase, partial [Candidatus Bipolaricaulota bacterium]|nr:cellulase family glycosylhydrolase [Candidatus Bipolaricaulota bacterium]
MRKALKALHAQPVYPVGVNYWPRRTAVEMWARWAPEGIAQDLREMRALGLNTVRFFLRTADFADSEGNLKAEALERLDAFLALCREQGLYALPTFFVGHMSGMNFPIPWERGRDFYTDPEVLARSRRFVSGIVSRYRDEEAILGWILSNEITHHAGKRETHILA